MVSRDILPQRPGLDTKHARRLRRSIKRGIGATAEGRTWSFTWMLSVASGADHRSRTETCCRRSSRDRRSLGRARSPGGSGRLEPVGAVALGPAAIGAAGQAVPDAVRAGGSVGRGRRARAGRSCAAVTHVAAAARSDGSRLLVEITSSPLSGNGGGSAQFLRDVTEPTLIQAGEAAVAAASDLHSALSAVGSVLERVVPA